MDTMNERLVLLRKEKKLTQEKFAKKINLTRSGLANIEQGTNSLTNRIISDICREFNVNEEWLRNGTGTMFRPKMTVDNDLAVALGKVLKSDDLFVKNCILLTVEILTKLDDEQKEWLKDRLKSLVDTVNDKEKSDQ